MHDRPSNFKIWVFLIGCVLIAFPIFFERLHSDEVFYWDISHNLYKGKGLISGIDNKPYVGHMPLPFLITAPVSFFGDHIYAVRFVAALFTIGCATLIFLIGQSLYSQNGAFISSLLFLTSFQALRYGGRFYMDQFGAFFFLLAILLLLKRRYFLAGFSAALMILGREYWLGVYPFFIAYLVLKRESITICGLPFITLRVAGLFYAASTVGLIYFFENQFTFYTFKHYLLSLPFLQKNAVSLLQSWLELIIVNFLIFFGFVSAWPLLKESRLWLLFLPQVAIISMIYGFIVNGGVTQYPLGLVASMSIFAGYGFQRLWDKTPLLMKYQRYFVTVMLVVITFQFIGLNILATKVTLHQNWGIYGIGYKDDAKIISLLRKKAAGEYIYGIHGAFVESRSRWNWTDFDVQQAIAEEPDWLITFDNHVKFIQPEQSIPEVEVYHIGPYLVFHSHPRGHLSELIAQADFPKWKLRK